MKKSYKIKMNKIEWLLLCYFLKGLKYYGDYRVVEFFLLFFDGILVY